MFLQLVKIKQKKELTEYTLQDNNPLSNFLTKGKTNFGFAILKSARGNYLKAGQILFIVF